MNLLKPCLECGDLTDGVRCTEHQVTTIEIKATSTARGYGTSWRKLSERARRMQPWCSDCGTDEDLTTDHSPEAWRRHDAGLPIRLSDVAVVCRSCNGKRGKARGGEVPRPLPDPVGKAEFGSHTPGGYA